MSASIFKRSLNAANIKVTTHREGGRSIEDGNMDEDPDFSHSSGGRGPRTIDSTRGHYRGGYNRGRGRGGRHNHNYNQHDDRDKSLTERLGERLGYKNRGRRGKRDNRYQLDNRHHQTDSGAPAGKALQWYQVTIPYGKKADKDFIFKSINELLDVPFMPQSFRYDGQAAVFYVEMSFSSIEALKAVNKRITMPNGFKMTLVVKAQEPPAPKVIEGELFERLLTTMSSLYDTENKVLNLESFHKNESLKPEVLLLNRNPVMMSVVNVITQHIPELVALNLSGNRLNSLVHLEPLVKSTPNLIALDLSNNPELRESELDRIKGWTLTEISLSGTPICTKNPDKALYLSAVRKKFPRIAVLDGDSVPAPIGFDIDTDKELGLPDRKGHYFGTSHNVVTAFLQEYYQLFDSDDRSPLMQAYHDDITFSTSFWYNPLIDKQPGFDIQNSRNLLKIESSAHRTKRLKYGKTEVIGFFTREFPKTTHILETLTADVLHESPEMLSFTVTGLYEETNPSKQSTVCRCFTRTFTTVPQGAGIVIISELFSFSNVTRDIRSNMIEASKRMTQAPAPQAPVPQVPAAAEMSLSHDLVQQQGLVNELMKATGMNAHWSQECLLANEWNLSKAAEMYRNLKAEGKIPQEAYH